jgi:hypothetical protein
VLLPPVQNRVGASRSIRSSDQYTEEVVVLSPEALLYTLRILTFLEIKVGLEQRSRYRDSLRAGRSEDRGRSR